MADDSQTGWLTLAAAALSAVAMREIWRPLGAWVARRLDLVQKDRSQSIVHAQETIRVLGQRLDAANTRILELSAEVATLKERTANQAEDIVTLQRELDRVRRQYRSVRERGTS